MTSLGGFTPDTHGPQRIAAVIPAHNVGHDIAATVRSCRAIPGVDLLIVVDDGSDDDTARAARAAGAVVVRHSVYRGRASAIETGVKVAAMRDRADWPDRHLLILSPDLGESAVESAALVHAVNSGLADCAISISSEVDPSGVMGHAQRVAHSAIWRATGWEAFNPLSAQRCLTREAVTAAMPFVPGYGLEVAMTIDLLEAGLSVVEIPCNFIHSGADRMVGELNRSARLTDSLMTYARRLFRRSHRAKIRQALPADYTQGVGQPYPRSALDRQLAESERSTPHSGSASDSALHHR